MKTPGTRSEKDQELLCQQLRDAIGAGDDELVLITYAFDVSPVPAQKPSIVVFSETRDDVVAVLQTVNQYKIPVTVMAGG